LDTVIFAEFVKQASQVAEKSRPASIGDSEARPGTKIKFPFPKAV
jgi:hypothetical protein